MDVQSATYMTLSPVVLSDDLIPEVLSFLSVKSLLRLRCVSKSWRALISDPVFVKLHLKKSSTRKTLFSLMKKHPLSESVDTHQSDGEVYCVLYPKSRLLHNPSFKLSVDSYYLSNEKDCEHKIAGSCNGLICLTGFSFTFTYREYWLRIWNPATRTLSPKIGYFRDSSNSPHEYYSLPAFDFKFGYDNSTDTYKVLATNIYLTGTVRILTLGDNVWRDIESFPVVPLKRIYRKSGGVYLGGTLNWLAMDNDFPYSVLKNHATVEQFRIVSLDLGTETYNQYMLPRRFDEMPPDMPTLGVLGDCLCFSYSPNKINFVIWKMQIFGVDESWVQFLKISYQTQHPDFHVVPLFLFEDTLILTSHKRQSILYNWRNNTLEEINVTIVNNRTTDYVESLVSIF
ncbi:F-box/kelch-repeat protein At3g23880-like [Cicer arietinum]|uniref:F-box/kelch-repeat protein At3g23880-like n=1 Tax=Cicer arietinum TaxID=3827 RepID=A0A1S2XQR3_CICAR|nr:F-box/kelch-repeat protein At3g23880-like [Cicer arietinum]